MFLRVPAPASLACYSASASLHGLVASVRELSELLTEKEVKAWRIADNHAIAMCGMFLFNEVVKWRRKEDLTGLTEYVSLEP